MLGSGNYGGNEKRRKPMQMSSMTYMLEDNDIIEDLKIINKNKAFSVRPLLLKIFDILYMRKLLLFQMQKINNQSSTSSTGGSSPSYYRDTRIEEGKLFYEKRW